MTTTDLFYAKSSAVIDDGCDHTALIIWRMNAGARARTRSAFVLPPVPVQVIKPRHEKAKPAKKDRTVRAKVKPVKTGFPARNLAAVMLGKTLTFNGVMMALDKHYPGHGLTKRNLQTRLTQMLNSPHVDIVRHEKPTPEYTLKKVDGCYYVNSEKSSGSV